nr:MAG TPA: Thiamine biosynthesis protein (ThiI) [Caudoviricetes sp.]
MYNYIPFLRISSEDIALIVQERGISSEKTRINVHSCTD